MVFATVYTAYFQNAFEYGQFFVFIWEEVVVHVASRIQYLKKCASCQPGQAQTSRVEFQHRELDKQEDRGLEGFGKVEGGWPTSISIGNIVSTTLAVLRISTILTKDIPRKI